MADDIVTRLREGANRIQAIIGDQLTMTEAADDIERLRKLTSRLAQLMMPYALLMTREEQQEVMKAVNDD